MCLPHKNRAFLSRTRARKELLRAEQSRGILLLRNRDPNSESIGPSVSMGCHVCEPPSRPLAARKLTSMIRLAGFTKLRHQAFAIETTDVAAVQDLSPRYRCPPSLNTRRRRQLTLHVWLVELSRDPQRRLDSRFVRPPRRTAEYDLVPIVP